MHALPPHVSALPAANFTYLLHLVDSHDPVLYAAFTLAIRTQDVADLIDTILRIGARWPRAHRAAAETMSSSQHRLTPRSRAFTPSPRRSPGSSYGHRGVSSSTPAALLAQVDSQDAVEAVRQLFVRARTRRDGSAGGGGDKLLTGDLELLEVMVYERSPALLRAFVAYAAAGRSRAAERAFELAAVSCLEVVYGKQQRTLGTRALQVIQTLTEAGVLTSIDADYLMVLVQRRDPVLTATIGMLVLPDDCQVGHNY